VSIDLGTGDGRLPWVLAREAPDRLFIGVDANAAALRERSGRAARDRQRNVLYVRAAVEDLPPELAAAADRVTVVLPWGSLLAAVARADSPLLRNIRDLTRPGARLTVVLGVDPERDRAECLRLGLPALDPAFLCGPLPEAYRAAGFHVTCVQSLTAEELARWPSTWARRLAHGRQRAAFQIDARAF
jgi:16S rRNA (adenine(1408)-N(1))-methyltransferase